MKIHQHNAGYITKMWLNTLKIFFSGTAKLILMKLCMKHQSPKPFIFCSNYDTGLTLTYLMARSNYAS